MNKYARITKNIRSVTLAPLSRDKTIIWDYLNKIQLLNTIIFVFN